MIPVVAATLKDLPFMITSMLPILVMTIIILTIIIMTIIITILTAIMTMGIRKATGLISIKTFLRITTLWLKGTGDILRVVPSWR